MKRDILKNFLVENRVCNIPYKLYSILHAACCWFPHSQRWNYLDFKGDDHPSGLNFYDQEVLFNSGLSIYNFEQSYIPYVTYVLFKSNLSKTIWPNAFDWYSDDGQTQLHKCKRFVMEHPRYIYGMDFISMNEIVEIILSYFFNNVQTISNESICKTLFMIFVEKNEVYFLPKHGAGPFLN